MVLCPPHTSDRYDHDEYTTQTCGQHSHCCTLYLLLQGLEGQTARNSVLLLMLIQTVLSRVKQPAANDWARKLSCPSWFNKLPLVVNKARAVQSTCICCRWYTQMKPPGPPRALCSSLGWQAFRVQRTDCAANRPINCCTKFTSHVCTAPLRIICHTSTLTSEDEGNLLCTFSCSPARPWA